MKIIELNKLLKPLYKDVNFKPILKKMPVKIKGLKFGFVCPGAMNTIKYLNKFNQGKEYKNIIKNISVFTDLLFFIEIIELYRYYIDNTLYKTAQLFLKNNSCEYSNSITLIISEQFALLPKNISKNIPDKFYHIRHNALICSKNKKIAKDRIKLLQSIYIL